MDKVLLATALAFIITYTAIPVIINVSVIKKLFDEPDARKLHSNPVPSLGGLGIFAGLIMACLMTISFDSAIEFQYFFAACLVIFFLGLRDDILVLTALKKFIGQIIAAFIIIYKGGIIISSMHGLLGVNELPEVFSLALTYVTVIVIINSFNLIDGVDGLAGSLGLFTSIVFGVYFYAIGHLAYSTFAFALGGSLLAFLIFNHSPARIFMGDTGSLLIGMANAILVIHFINVADQPGSLFQIKAAPAVGVAILIVPLYDTLRVFAIRIFNRRSPFSPDRNHVHHLLLDRGLSHSATTFILVTVNILFAVAAYALSPIGVNYLFAFLVGAASIGIGMLYFTKPKPKLFLASDDSSDESEGRRQSKIMPLNPNKAVAEQN